MTGYGSARVEVRGRALLVEVRSVNHKFCDVRTRLPRELLPHDAAIQEEVRALVGRGRVDLSVERDARAGHERVELDLELARAYAGALSRLESEVAGDDAWKVPLIAGMPGVFEVPSAVDLDAADVDAVLAAVRSAVTDLRAMRRREGRALAAALGEQLDAIDTTVSEIAAELPREGALRAERLRQRVAEVASDVRVDELRLAQEVALLAERADVREELDRLSSHLGQFRGVLEGGDAVGRRLEFLLQEMNREVNTVGSKSGSAKISHAVVDLKVGIERLREQVQNLE